MSRNHHPWRAATFTAAIALSWCVVAVVLLALPALAGFAIGMPIGAGVEILTKRWLP